MTKFLTNIASIKNIYEKPSNKSGLASQLLYGESFSILKKNKNWLKIITKEDKYTGYIQNNLYSKYFKPSHKISVLRAKIFKSPKRQKKISELSFNSKIKFLEKKKKFIRFEKGWINKNDLKPIIFKNKKPFEKIKIFKNIKYKWGGKSFKGIDCSALVQLCLNFNNIYCPRDTKDQVRYFKKNVKLKNIKKDNIIFWKGHVAVALARKKVIHAYGPLKKTVIMDLHQTINRIKNTANLLVTKIKVI